MKILLKIVVGVIVALFILLVVLRITGFPPTVFGAGLWLSGHPVTTPVTDWSFADNYQTVEIQTDAWYLLPHSVTIWCVTYNGQLYLASLVPNGAPQYPLGRQWNRNVARDPHVRVKIGDNLYDVTLTYVTDPAEHDAVVRSYLKKYPQFKLGAGDSFNVFRAIGG